MDPKFVHKMQFVFNLTCQKSDREFLQDEAFFSRKKLIFYELSNLQIFGSVCYRAKFQN